MTREQEIREYCEHHPLDRPRIHWFPVLLLFLFLGFPLRVVSSWLCHRYGLTTLSSYIIAEFANLAIFGRWMAILLVKLYQRYAPEEIRRRCHCMPSCSEYAIIAFKKYGLIYGGVKTFKRIFFKCGKEYTEDFP